MTPLAARARHAFLAACALDVAVRKPGNVSAASPGHGMQARHFLDSAAAAAGPLFEPGATVGARIEGAVRATLAAAGCNTNLGIVLLCAPIARLADIAPDLPADALAWRAGLEHVLAALDRADAAAAFRAIAAARPGGLGHAEAEDVHAPPTVTLREAMRLAAARDRIALQYANGYADLFDTGLAALPAHGRADAAAVQSLYLAFLGRHPDSHIVRKHGAVAAQDVTDEALPWLLRSDRGEPVGLDPAFAAWDEALKARGLNPGTTADLTVATLCLAGAIEWVDLGAPP